MVRSFLKYRVRAQSASAKEAETNQKVMDMIDKQYKKEKRLKNQSNETKTGEKEEIQIDSGSENETNENPVGPIVIEDGHNDRDIKAVEGAKDDR